MQSTESELRVQRPEHRAQNREPRHRVQSQSKGTEHTAHSTVTGEQSTKHRAQSAEPRSKSPERSTEHRAPSTDLRARSRLQRQNKSTDWALNSVTVLWVLDLSSVFCALHTSFSALALGSCSGLRALYSRLCCVLSLFCGSMLLALCLCSLLCDLCSVL